jgi:hypothetical protein
MIGVIPAFALYVALFFIFGAVDDRPDARMYNAIAQRLATFKIL